VIGVLLYPFDQSLNLRDLGTIRWDGVGLCLWFFVGERIQSCDGFVAGARFAGGDEDFGTSCLEESVRLIRIRLETRGKEKLPRGSVKSQASRSTAYDCDFAFQAEDVGEVVQLNVLIRCGHCITIPGFKHREASE
jgi:hypothetical protein